MRARRSTRAVAAAAGMGLLLGGCSMLEGDDGADGGSSASQSDGGSEDTSDGGEGSAVTGDENGAKQAGIDLENPPKPIAEVTLPIADEDDIDSTKVELLELKRHENVMLATFRMTGEGRGNKVTSVFRLLGGSGFRPVFIDMENLEKYRNVSGLTSNENDTKASLGEPVFIFTAFPLPREGVEVMDLQVSGGAPVIPDVPMPQ